MTTNSTVPWSAEAERDLRRKIRNVWAEMWAGWICGVFFFVFALVLHRYWLLLLAAFGFGYFVACLYVLASTREKLGEEMRRLPTGEIFEGSGMLANKPRLTSRLTKWVQHPSDGVQFVCNGYPEQRPEGRFFPSRCGRLHHWSDAQWIPNYDPEAFEPEEHPGTVDPGGGRFVILCSCGLGHFKLKVLTGEDIASRAAKT